MSSTAEAKRRRREEREARLRLIERQVAEGTLVIRQARPGELLPPKNVPVSQRASYERGEVW